REKLRRTLGFQAEASHVDDGILLSFAPGQVPPAPERLVRLVGPEEVEALLGRALIGSPLFTTRFRHAAVRALYVPRMSRGQRTPAYLQRLKADALMEAVGGQAEFPVVAETLRECFHDLGDLTGEEIASRAQGDAEALLASLRDERRVVVMDFASGRRAFIPTPDAPLYQALATDEGLERVALRLLRTRGPVTAAWLAERYGFEEADAERALERLAERGLVRRGAFLAEAPAPQYVHLAVLDEIQRRQVHARRVPRAVVPAERFSAFLLRRQHLHPDHRLTGPAGVLAALELLQGEDFPARVWEEELLSARVEGYAREWLDRLGLSGEIVWTPFERRPGRVG